jgi:hypothetical protein
LSQASKARLHRSIDRPPWYDVSDPAFALGTKQVTVGQYPHSANPHLLAAKGACLAQIDEVTRWLRRTRNLVTGVETYTREAFQHLFTEVQEGFPGAGLDLDIALYEF